MNFQVGQYVHVPVGYDADHDYVFPMEVVAVNDTRATLQRRINYDPAILAYYYGREAN